MEKRRRILWVDDDGPDRFRYAESRLKREGWEVEWAQDVFSAAQKLSKDAYEGVILDQETPLDPNDSRSRWAGCILLHWLRGNSSPPPGLPPLELSRHGRIALAGRPHTDNLHCPVVVISDYDAPGLITALRSASPADVELPILPKPLKLEDLRSLLETWHE
ncbi:MAG TPA: hypothetical protein PLA94_03415 [Myxococcota bacterium]|nr:hypothetical protein [Myxococcota bacterium]HND29015.1 hypothetical protein [Myxococcota bacterium]